jgi:hypothetical protein
VQQQNDHPNVQQNDRHVSSSDADGAKPQVCCNCNAAGCNNQASADKSNRANAAKGTSASASKSGAKNDTGAHPFDQVVVEDDDDEGLIDVNSEKAVVEGACEEDLKDKQEEIMTSRVKMILTQKRIIQGLKEDLVALQGRVDTVQNNLAQSEERERANSDNMKNLQRSLARARDEIRSFSFRQSHCTCTHRMYLTIRAARGLPPKDICVCARIDEGDRFGRTEDAVGPQCTWGDDASSRAKMTCDFKGSVARYLTLEIWGIGGGSGILNMSRIQVETLPGEEDAGECWVPLSAPSDTSGQNNGGSFRRQGSSSAGNQQHESTGSSRVHDSSSTCSDGGLLQSISYGQTVCSGDGPALLVSIWREPVMFTGTPERSTNSEHRPLSPRAERIVRELQKRIDALTYTLQQSRDKPSLSPSTPMECQIFPKGGTYDVTRLPVTFAAVKPTVNVATPGNVVVYYTLDGSRPSEENHAGHGHEPLTVLLERSARVKACVCTLEEGCGRVQTEEYELLRTENEHPNNDQSATRHRAPGVCASRMPDSDSRDGDNHKVTSTSTNSSKSSAAVKLPRAGVGILLSKSNDHRGLIRVRKIEPSGPAARDGRTKAGDMLIAVDGVSVEGKDLDTVMKMVVGDEGTSVFLMLERPPGCGSPHKAMGMDTHEDSDADGQRKVSVACVYV